MLYDQDPFYLTYSPTFGFEGRFASRPQEYHKSVVRRVKRVVRKIVRSPIGKIALGVAAAYTGGAALGLWGAGSAAGAGAALSSEALLAGKIGSSALKSSFSLGSVLAGGSKALQAIGAINTLTGAQKQQVVQDYGPQIAAARRNELKALQEQQKQEKEVVQQQNQVADQREKELSASLAAQKNAIIARRRGRGGLAFTGPTTGLKETLGG